MWLNMGGWLVGVQAEVKKVLEKHERYRKSSLGVVDRFCD